MPSVDDTTLGLVVAVSAGALVAIATTIILWLRSRDKVRKDGQ